MKGRVPVKQPKVAARCFSLSSEMLIGTIIDLAKLTLRPVEEAKEFNKAFRVKSCLPHPSMIISVSSAYCRIGKSLVYCSGTGKLSIPRFLALFTMIEAS